MPQSLARVLVHLTFSTKDRRPSLKDKDLRSDLYSYMAGIFRKLDSTALLIGGVDDHVHALFPLSRNHALKEVVGKVKAESSSWIKKQAPTLSDFYWQGGYGAFSVSESNVEPVKSYILNQERHHHRVTFQEEFRLLCEKHGLEIDERYVWD